MKILLLSTYDLGPQPFGLASPAAWLSAAGARVTCNDVAVEPLHEEAAAAADLIAIHLPMHTATRLATAMVPRLRTLNGRAHLCFFGLYAPVNEAHLRGLGAGTVLGGEFEAGLVSLYRRLASGGGGHQSEPVISHAKQRFLVPDRTGLPPLGAYGKVELAGGERRTIGYTEASRGCKHLCRHCPVVPVYGGRFRVVQPDVVLADIDRQVAAGARHISFGDPDFFNGVGHAMGLVEELHRGHPDISYDVTIKIEHLLSHADRLKMLADTGCLSITTAVESVDDAILDILAKDHSRADFERAVELTRAAGLCLAPTFIPFTPWTTRAGFLDLLHVIARLDLVEQVAPVQLAIRLLVPQGSLLLGRREMQLHLDGFDAASLSHRWHNPDRSVDALHEDLRGLVEQGEAAEQGRRDIFAAIWRRAHLACDIEPLPLPPTGAGHPPPPRFSEPWYCCAEPTEAQLARV